MATKFYCDVEGCEKTHAQRGRGGPLQTPDGWAMVQTVITLSDSDLRKARRPDILREHVGRVRDVQTRLVCPDHDLPRFKDLPESDMDNDYGELIGI